MEAKTVAHEDLFDPEFLESLKRLHIKSGRVAHGGRHAEHRSKDLGGGIEFSDYRPYTEGDDLRAVDWNIYRRLGKVFLRLFEELEDFPVYLLTDCSDSMFLETPPRARRGLRSALALASIALNQHDTVGLFSFGADMKPRVRPMSGKGRLMRFAEAMSHFAPSGPTDFETSLRRFSALRLRRGLAVIVSDLFDPRGADAVIKGLKRLRHKILIVQLCRSTDRSPDIHGDVRLRDCETGQVEDVSATAGVLEHYRESYDRFQAAIAEFARSRGAGLLRMDVDRPVLPQLASLFATGTYVA